jgi:hypothetical protein
MRVFFRFLFNRPPRRGWLARANRGWLHEHPRAWHVLRKLRREVDSMRELLRALHSLRVATEESIRRQQGDADSSLRWSGYGCQILRNRVAVLREEVLRFAN